MSPCAYVTRLLPDSTTSHVTSHSKLAVLHAALNPVTGVWSVMKELARAQARSGLYQTVGIGVIADRCWPELCRDELNTCELPHFLTGTPKAFGTGQFLWQRIQRPPLERWIKELLRNSGAERGIIHFHNAWLSGVFLPLGCGEASHIRAVATVHGVNANFKCQPIRKRAHRWMANRLIRYRAALTSVDKRNLQRAEDLLKLSAQRFVVIPNGIADTTIRRKVRRDGSKELTVGHVGSIISAKGWQILVEAATQLRRKGYSIKVILAGRGEESELAGEMAQRTDGWLSFEGFVANPRETVMPRLDALILMSEQEGLPMAIIEAMSIGLPIVATEVGGIPEAVINGENGLIIPRSVDALAETLERLLTEPELLRRFGIQCRNFFEQRFEISQVVSKYHSVYSGN